MNTPTIDAILKEIRSAENIAILCHTHADGDTLGSAFALSRICARLGKGARVLVPDGIPERLAFLSDGINLSEDCEECDLIIAVDVASPEQLGSLSYLADRINIKIDHHALGTPFGEGCTIELVEPDAAAAGEMVFDISTAAGDTSPHTADLLYAAIAADTGSFRYSNTTERSFACAKELARRGADISAISEALFESQSMREALACGHVYSGMQSLCDSRALVCMITSEARHALGTLDEDYGNASSLMRSIAGVSLSCAIKQDEDDKTHFKCSMRSRTEVDCAAICARFGGGGHVRAAGCTIVASSPDEALEKVRRAIEEALK